MPWFVSPAADEARKTMENVKRLPRTTSEGAALLRRAIERQIARPSDLLTAEGPVFALVLKPGGPPRSVDALAPA